MTETDFAAMVDHLVSIDELISFLREDNPVYDGKSESATYRMRGWTLSRLARTGSTDPRLEVFGREELETGTNLYSLAAAARLLLNFDGAADLAKTAQARLVSRDEPIQFDTYPIDGAAKSTTSTQAELQKLIQRASTGLIGLSERPKRLRTEDIMDFSVEDQDASKYPLGEFLLGRPSFLIFFYSRCNNPNKCTANIRRWDEVRQALTKLDLHDKVNLAAITYDPEFDSPAVLRAYARSRGIVATERARLIRVPDRFIEMRRLLELLVNYSQATVNRHASEAMILSAKGQHGETFSRLFWTVDEAMTGLTNQLAS